jgi:hypothetical protein
VSQYDAESRARRVAERAAEAWYQTQGSSDYDTAVGVVAALAMTARGPGRADPAQQLAIAKDGEIVEILHELWSLFWIRRPELARLVGPLAGWVNDDPLRPGKLRAIASVARAAVKAGLLDLAHGNHLYDTDVIGMTYLHMRSDSAKSARGEFYTPPALCRMMAEMILGSKDDMTPGMSIAEPAAGTGGMVRGAAEAMRARGLHPADFWWVLNDISPVAVAGLAVNCHLWDLGPHVIIGVADTLADPGWPDRTWKEQQEVTEHRDQLLGQARMLAMFRALLAGDARPAAAVPEPPAAPVRPRLPLPKGPAIQLSLFDGEVA